MDRSEYRIGMVVIGKGSDPTRDNHVNSGFRITDVNENGIVVQRIHASYLGEDPVESWTIYWPQVERFGITPVPTGTQLPLL